VTTGSAGTPAASGTSPVVAGTKSNNGGMPTTLPTGGNSGAGTTSTAGVGGATGGTTPVEEVGGAAGAGGDGGSPQPVKCEDAPIPLKGSWKASASHSSLGVGDEYYNPPQNVMDLSSKRWSTGKVQAGDEWLQIDFGAPAAFRELSFTLNPDDADDYPRIYQIQISDTPLDFNGPIRASGAGPQGQTLVVTLSEPVVGRYLLVQQKGKDPVNWWSVSELNARCF
jgi:F5/8 type C domain